MPCPGKAVPGPTAAAPGFGPKRCGAGPSGEFAAQRGAPRPDRAKSGKPANLLFFRPVLRKRRMNGRAGAYKEYGPESEFFASYPAWRSGLPFAPKVAQGKALPGAPQRRGGPARQFFFNVWTGLSRSGKRAKLLFFQPNRRNLILNDCTKTKAGYPGFRLPRLTPPPSRARPRSCRALRRRPSGCWCRGRRPRRRPWP